MADFSRFGTPSNNGDLGFEFTFDGDELDRPQQSKYRLIPEGEYAFTVSNVEPETSSKGSNMMKVTLSIELEEGEARVTDNLVLTQKAKWKVAAFFAAIGMWDEVKAYGVKQDTWDKCIGKAGKFINSHRKYEGKEFNQVERYLTPNTPAVR